MDRDLRILHIEDDPNDAELVARKLRGAGFRVAIERVERFEDVQAAIARGSWDVILSDHAMPGFRSSDVLDLLRARADAPPLIILSGAIGEEEVVDALHRGVASYVDKDSLSRLVPMIERSLEQAELRRSHAVTLERLELVQAAVESTDHVIFILEATPDAAPKLIFANEAACSMTGFDEDELLELGFAGLHGHDGDPQAVERLMAAMTSGETSSAELQLRHKDGARRWVETGIRPIAAGSHRFVCVSRDITERKNHEAQLAFLARHDPLTGLPNRAYLDDRLRIEFAKARRSHQPFTLMIVDVDHFKQINDQFGHGCGDEVLRAVSHRLRGCVREVDAVARLGGDEFVLVLTALDARDAITEIAQRALAEIREPAIVDGATHYLTASIGAAISTPDCDQKTLMRAADAALYRVKEAGRDAFSF